MGQNLPELYQIQVRDDETKERFEEAREAVAGELGVEPDELHRWEIVREAVEAYLGGEPLGRWREGR